jgi:AcrR family transcriptional regulator
MASHKRQGRSTKRSQPRSTITRARLLSVATIHFQRHTYEGVSLRAIAREAHVDVALIARYFGSKEGLYREVMRRFAASGFVAMSLGSDRAKAGEAIANWLFSDDLETRLGSLLFALHASTSSHTLPILREAAAHSQISTWLGGRNPRLRAHLIGSFVTAITVARVVNDELFAPDEIRAAAIAHVAQIIQAYIDDQWTPPGNNGAVRAKRKRPRPTSA